MDDKIYMESLRDRWMGLFHGHAGSGMHACYACK